ncbi:MAG TPA: IS200/IS605 family transposase [Blastocatellia bacterium]|nr:IS200/IS605 family transposase [Blastocatellia bacterium]
MSIHSYSRCWLHLTWVTLKRERVLPKNPATKLSGFLYDYAESKGVYMKINYVNPEHVHALIDLPTKYSIEEVMKLLKGASSHWTNENRLIPEHFSWGRGYGAFSVSHSMVDAVAKYIANQEEHHRKKTFAEEYAQFVRAYGLQWRDDAAD